ncbi:MAG: pyruvate kinase [Rhodoferax sp.]
MNLHKPPADTSITSAQASAGDSLPWDREVCLGLIAQLWSLRQTMLARESQLQPELGSVLPQHHDSARNLIHYLSLRTVDLRPLQEQLAKLGLSSLGRAESHVLANLDKVLGLLHRLTDQDWQDRSGEEPVGSVRSRAHLVEHTDSLLGPAPPDRPVRIMVTLPSEAAQDFAVVRDLVNAGMDIARINCAHDGPQDWKTMALHVRRAAQLAQRPIKILMDLGGPKIRTGEMPPLAPVLKLKPSKDQFGRVFRPARLHLRPINSQENIADVDASVGVWEVWLERLKPGSSIEFSDARGAKRHLMVVHVDAKGAIAESLQTAYLTPETVLSIGGTQGTKKHATLVCQIDSPPGTLHLHRGDVLHLTDGSPMASAADDDTHDPGQDVAHITCTLPQAIHQVKPGARIWFDDGRIGGIVRHSFPNYLAIEITQARDAGEKLAGDKGINLPDSQLDLPALTPKDLLDLQTVAAEADMVGLSFVQRSSDVDQLRKMLAELGRADMGLVLKIETLQGFENLPELMLSAMAASSAGIMIARGDLAVECGYERMAEVQEEILWCAEAGHMPVIWATQVLESLAKTGLPSRAEISDAGLGVRAECVMLNKGPYITQAIRTLDDILKRMGGHQDKKRPLLRALRAWGDNPTLPSQ